MGLCLEGTIFFVAGVCFITNYFGIGTRPKFLLNKRMKHGFCRLKDFPDNINQSQVGNR